MSKQDTKQHLLDVGTALLIRDGFYHTGLNEVLAKADVPKGSFYYYFESKDDFGLQVLDNFARNNRAVLQRYLDDRSTDALTRLRAYFNENIQQLADQRYRCGCLIGNMAQEMSDQSETFREALQLVMADWVTQMADLLRQAQTEGTISATANVEALADFALNSWQGAVLRMKVVKDVTPLESFLHFFFDLLSR